MKTTEIVSRPVAEATVKKWLDHKRVSEGKRKAFSAMIDTMTEAVIDGTLSLNEATFELKHTLVFPILNDKNEPTVTELKYISRLNDFLLNAKKHLVKDTDFDGSMMKVKLALTNADVNVLRSLDSTTDKQIADAIAIFFV